MDPRLINRQRNRHRRFSAPLRTDDEELFPPKFTGSFLGFARGAVDL